jgi:signal transduction histidine kinase
VVSFQGTVLLVLGSLALMNYTGGRYYQALILTMLGVAAALLVFGLLWNPPGGFAGLKTYLSRYLLSVGLPFETWLQQLAEGAEAQPNAAGFLTFAMTQMASLPWVVGATWESPDDDGEFGVKSANCATFVSHELSVSLYTEISLSPAIVLHIRLLTQLLGEFYEAKRREQMLQQNAYMQAVHETGAHLTHDVKNLLQSLYSLSSAGQNMKPAENDSYALMVQRQLPQLTKRLQLTLEKLQSPAARSRGITVSLHEWWGTLQSRYSGRAITFEVESATEQQIPLTLFDSVAENLLENARQKRIRDPEVRITASLRSDSGASFSICDSGTPVPPDLLRGLFRQPVTSAAGMGIGLFQAARQAEQAGYRLSLSNNEPGAVCFTLKQTAPSQPESGS